MIIGPTCHVERLVHWKFAAITNHRRNVAPLALHGAAAARGNCLSVLLHHAHDLVGRRHGD
jgi:hypothetical protein